MKIVCANRLLSITLVFCGVLACIFAGCVSGGAVSAEEYFAIGMAYYDMGKFEEAEKWLNRARAKDKTQNASEYNLGRIAFETGRYEDAIKHFESILKRDPDNVMALKAAAYTHIRNGDIEKAEELYNRLLILVPESADDGYNYALVLFAMKKYAEAEQVLKDHEFALLDNNDVLLLYARAQKEQEKPEAIDSYAAWLANNSDAKVRYEFAQLLEFHEMYARALEEYQLVLDGLRSTNVDPSQQELHFSLARVLLIADGENSQGLTELREAVEGGFDDFETIEKLLDDERISAANKDSIRTIITEGRRAAEAAEASETAKQEQEEGDDTEGTDDEGDNE
jgi:tetratricopeptide (TPR) repeat protein